MNQEVTQKKSGALATNLFEADAGAGTQNIKQEDLKILAQVNPGAWIQLENIVLKRQQQELMNQIKIMGTEKIKESKNGVVETKEKVK